MKLSCFSDKIIDSNNDDNNEDKSNRIKKLVYLTSDAEHTLETLDDNTAYIIGGIVDRNRLKGVTYNKANNILKVNDKSFYSD
jgi:tRNA (guanine9-N1)-methyltransferase